jgi:hypothetical protein
VAASLNWADVIEITRAQAKQSKLLLLEDIGFTGTSWQPFAQAPLLVEMSAEVDVNNSKIAVFLKNAFMPDTATGEAHTRTARSFYNIERNEATEARHLVTLSCATGEGPHSLNAGDVVLSHATSQQTFRLVEGNSVTFPDVLSSGTPKTYMFEAEVAGSAANVANSSAEVSLQLVTTLAGVTITSHSLYSAGVDEEDELRLRDREQLQWALLTQFELIDDAVKALALAASSSIVHVAVDSSNPRGAGTFDVYIAGLDATASDDDVGKAQIAIERRAFGRTDAIPASKVKKSPTVEVEIAGSVYFNGEVSQVPAVTAAVEDALREFIRGTPSGGFDYTPGPRGIIRKNDLESVVREAVKTLTGRPCTVELTTPTGDIGVPLYGRPIFITPVLSYQAVTSNQ